MEQMYKHLVRDLTVPQALRLAMLCLARRPATDQKPSRVVESVADSEQDGEEVDFKGHVAGWKTKPENKNHGTLIPTRQERF